MRRRALQALLPRLTRWEMLRFTAGLGVSLALDKSGVAWAAETDGLLPLDLGGDKWTLREEGRSETVPALVPGSTYTNLLKAGKIPDPFFGENNGKVQWVAEKNWFFERNFEVFGELHAKKHLELVCHGLDTRLAPMLAL